MNNYFVNQNMNTQMSNLPTYCPPFCSVRNCREDYQQENLSDFYVYTKHNLSIIPYFIRKWYVYGRKNT